MLRHDGPLGCFFLKMRRLEGGIEEKEERVKEECVVNRWRRGNTTRTKCMLQPEEVLLEMRL